MIRNILPALALIAFTSASHVHKSHTNDVLPEVEQSSIIYTAATASGFPMMSSSDWDVGSGASRAAMHIIWPNGRPGVYDHWCSGKADQNQWLQVSFLSEQKVTAVALQGWVTYFRITYTIDGITWLSYDNDRIFASSQDASV